MIDFKEISPANGSVNQDKFEQFARDFLLASGYSIIEDPNRGADGGIDIKVKDIRKGVGNTEVFLLVSCKHNAHSGESVTANMEQDLQDRVSRHGCSGFIGFYSTIANNSLVSKLRDLKTLEKISEFVLYDNSKIESHILKIQDGKQLFRRYFPGSYGKWKEGFETAEKEEPVKRDIFLNLTKEDFLEAALTANIITEIIGIKTAFEASKWEEKEEILGRLFAYSDYSNIRIAEEVIRFLARIASNTRSGFSAGLAITIDSLVCEFFPYSEKTTDRQGISDFCISCINMSFNIIYDSTIYLDNLAIAAWSLSTVKYVHNNAKLHKSTDVIEKVAKAYDELESTLKRPERNDLGPALKLVQFFRRDLDVEGTHFPIFPADLYARFSVDSDRDKKPISHR